MLFNSYVFIFAFLPITLIGYFCLNKAKQYTIAKFLLVVASLIFYGYFNISYLWIIILSILFNYSINKLFNICEKKDKFIWKKILFTIGLFANVFLLFFYKYLDFVLESINNIFNTDFVYLNLLLPLGISFFTFQQVSYLIDSYKNKVPDYNILDYSLFVTFFPQLIAGPIVLHNEVIPQFENEANKRFNIDNFSKGIYAFSLGLAKKVLIADNFGKIVTFGYGNIASLNSIEAILTILAYTIQIYFDFSGYCDMASGIGLMFNIELPTNFNSPYKACNISDFWKRWHMTLTRFLTNYIYFPLGGSRCSKLRTYFNVLVVFVVSGIWHGAGWTFILWGLMHGIAMVVHRAFRSFFDKVPKGIMWLFTFVFINLSWVYFRAESIVGANAMILNVFNGGFEINFELAETLYNIIPISILANIIPVPNVLNIVMIGILLAFITACIFMKNTYEKTDIFIPNKKNFFTTYVILIYSILSLSGVSTFLYFNF